MGDCLSKRARRDGPIAQPAMRLRGGLRAAVLQGGGFHGRSVFIGNRLPHAEPARGAELLVHRVGQRRMLAHRIAHRVGKREEQVRVV